MTAYPVARREDLIAEGMTPEQADYFIEKVHIPALIEEETRELRAREKLPEEAKASNIGTATLADLPYGDPPEQLVPPFLAPKGVTILYGPGGVGKGWMSLWLTLMLVRSGLRVMVIDFELHDEEWGARARRLGFSDEELKAVHYRAPFGDDWTAKRGSLFEVADLLRADCDALAVDHLVIDSYVPATSTGDSMGGAAAAQEFYNGISRIGRPALTLAHVANAAGRFPDKPFGSSYVHNFARETWAVEDVSSDVEDQETFDAKVFRVLPEIIRLELRNKKKSAGAKVKRPQFMTFSFFTDGHIEVSVEAPKGKSHLAMVTDILSRAKEPMTVAAIVKAMKDDLGEAVKPEAVRTVFSRHPRGFESTNEPTRRWSLKAPREG